MFVLLYVVCILLAVVQMIWFEASMLLCIVAIAAAGAGIGCYILRKKLPKVAGIAANVACAVVTVLTLILTGNGKTGGKVDAYRDGIEEASALLEQGDLDEALDVLEELDEDYGSDENSLFLRAAETIKTGDYEDAYEIVNQMQDKTSMQYYLAMEMVYQADPAEATVEKIYKLYQEAADRYPSWAHMQQMNGAALFEQENYEGALYYLQCAEKLEPGNGITAYYMGACYYYLNNHEKSVEYFDVAYVTEIPESYKKDIIWYAQQMLDKEGE